MPHPEREHELQIALATALRERDAARALAEKWARIEGATVNRGIRADADALSEIQGLQEALAAARRECEDLKAALTPFALLGAEIAASIPDSKPLWGFGSVPAMTAGDIRRAAALAAPAAGEEGT